jgi:hypothetical protein
MQIARPAAPRQATPSRRQRVAAMAIAIAEMMPSASRPSDGSIW